MKLSHDEGIASHIGPEACAFVRKNKGEALTGERAGNPSYGVRLGILRFGVIDKKVGPAK